MRHRSAALTDTAGVYHVASRLTFEGFHAAVARGGTSRQTCLRASLVHVQMRR